MKTTACNCAAVDIGAGALHEPGCPSQVVGGVEVCEQCGNPHEPVCAIMPVAPEPHTELEEQIDPQDWGRLVRILEVLPTLPEDQDDAELDDLDR